MCSKTCLPRVLRERVIGTLHRKIYVYSNRVKSRLELGDCLQKGCLQGGSDNFEHGGEAYSLNSLLRGAKDGLVDAVNSFSKLHGVWDKYAAVISMFISIRFVVIIFMLGAVFLK